jgi:hypothetical protein
MPSRTLAGRPRGTRHSCRGNANAAHHSRTRWCPRGHPPQMSIVTSRVRRYSPGAAGRNLPGSSVPPTPAEQASMSPTSNRMPDGILPYTLFSTRPHIANSTKRCLCYLGTSWFSAKLSAKSRARHPARQHEHDLLKWRDPRLAQEIYSLTHGVPTTVVPEDSLIRIRPTPSERTAPGSEGWQY